MVTAERRRDRRRAGILLAILALLLAALVSVPARFPDPFGLALGVEALLPWVGILIALVLISALARRRWLGTLVALAAVVAWSVAFVPRALPLTVPRAAAAEASATSRLSVISQNLHGSEGDPEAAAHAALAAAPDLIAFQEIDGSSRDVTDAVLGAHYPYVSRVGSVSLWSIHPITADEPLDLGLGWNRALRATVAAPGGEVEVYVVHAASARIGDHGPRDRMLTELTELIRTDDSPRILALGDFNAGTDDRALAPLSDLLVEPRQTAGGFGFTWPAQFPVVRLDHVFVRGLTALSVETERLGASDHLGVSAEFSLS